MVKIRYFKMVPKVQPMCFLACPTYDKQPTIEKTGLSHQVLSQGRCNLKKKPPKFSPAETDPSDVSLQESCGNLSCQTPLLLMAFPSVLFPPRFNLCRNLSSMRNALTNTVRWLGLTFCFYPYGKPDPKISVFLRLA